METIKKRSFNKQTRRKRTSSSDEDETKLFKKPLVQKTLLSASTSRAKPVQENSDISLGVSFASSGTAASLVQDTSTRTLDYDEGEETVAAGDQAEALDGLNNYTGMKDYKEYINKTKPATQMSSGIRIGPLRSTSYVRTSSRFDYAPAVCKDYKDSGYCGFGDSCVFLHDRTDYKHGWQIDKEWEEEQRRNTEALDPDRFFIGTWTSHKGEGKEVEHEEADSDDDLPFAVF
jgi:RING finger protein 113A